MKQKIKALRDFIISKGNDQFLRTNLDITELMNALKESMNRMLAEQIMYYTGDVQSIKKDGHCLFASILSWLTATQNKVLLNKREQRKRNVSSVREMIADYLESNQDEMEQFILDSQPFEKYLDGVKCNAWGGEIEIQASSKLFEINIEVYVPAKETDGLLYVLLTRYKYSDDAATISIVFNGRNHYDVLTNVKQVDCKAG